MKTFVGYWEERGCACCRHEEQYIGVTANTESEALGMALAYRPDSTAYEWTITELNPDVEGIKEL